MLLQNKGHFLQNVKVLKDREGELVVGRRPSNRKQAKAYKYLPCYMCLGIYQRDTLWVHAKHCPGKISSDGVHTGEGQTYNLQHDGYALI